MKRVIVLVLLSVVISGATAQSTKDTLRGTIFEALENDKLSPIPGASVFWMNTSIGITTDAEGKFTLPKSKDQHMLVVKSVGYGTDTLHVSSTKKPLSIVLKEGSILKDVEVVYRKGTATFLTLDPRNTQVLSTGELRKAACCNLAESFETNPSVDASFTDAVTGTKQIQMLGLSGKYTQIMQENMPSVRGLSTIYGLELIPGAWINSIYLSKGAGSVVNGYESVTGQINIDMKKPGNAEKFHLNIYGNQASRAELNAYYDKTVGKYWETTFLIHGKNLSRKNDRNNDGFLDNPLSDNYVFSNVWHLVHPNGWRVETGVNLAYMDTRAGQISGYDDSPKLKTPYTVGIKNVRAQAFLKTGYVFENEDYKSLGMQFSGVFHEQDTRFGFTPYYGLQSNFSYNLIFQDELGENDKHFYKTGVSFMYDDYDILYQDDDFSRTEYVPGAFLEYNYDNGGSISIISGVRGDYNSLYNQFFVTPRLHARYSIDENTSVKLGAGRGQRTPNVFAENIGLLATSRRWNFVSQPFYGNEGILPEIAWNVGLNFTKQFEWDYRNGTFTVDVYRTDFQNQLVVDVDTNPQEVNIYNLEGRSFSNSAQAEFNYELFSRFDVRLAYRWLDVQTDQLTGRLTRPLVPKHRAFINLAYETKKDPFKSSQWQFDLTGQWFGTQRLPNTSLNPEAYRLNANAPSYMLFNGQITRIFSEKFDMYLGVENILNYRQDNAILAADDPFGSYFDSSIVYAPIFGRMLYLGLRYTIK